MYKNIYETNNKKKTLQIFSLVIENVSLLPIPMQFSLFANIVIFDKSLFCSGMSQTWQF